MTKTKLSSIDSRRNHHAAEYSEQSVRTMVDQITDNRLQWFLSNGKNDSRRDHTVKEVQGSVSGWIVTGQGIRLALTGVAGEPCEVFWRLPADACRRVVSVWRIRTGLSLADSANGCFVVFNGKVM